jgi:cytochrome P450
MTWSPFAAAVMSDPAAGHDELLRHCPVHRCDAFEPPFYTLSRYHDVTMALRDIQTFSSEHGQGPRFTEPQGMLCDPPKHTGMRKIVQSAFTPKAMAALKPRVTRLAHALLDDVVAGEDTFDMHDDFAFPLPVMIIAGLLGVPSADLGRFKHWSDVQVTAMGAEDPSPYAADQAAFLAYMREHLRDRRTAIARAAPVPTDLLTAIAGARSETNELIAEADALSILMQLLVGGNETTTSLITNLVWRLLEVPDRWRSVVADITLIPAAIEESLRYDPPVLGLFRNTTREVMIRGVTIPALSKVFINYAAANRDADVFADPNTFDLWRGATRHMAFGLGVHFCLGAPMARLEAEIALRALIERIPELKLLDSGERIGPFFLWGRRKLPVSRR